jgi:uncharacterized protein YndB with AHSA1/START domain
VTDGSRVLVALRVPATAARAFDAFTAEIGRWWRPNTLFEFSRGRTDGTLAFEPGVGGRLVESYPDGGEFVIGDVRAWEPPHRLVVGWRQAGFAPDHDTELHVRFEPVDDGPGAAPQTRVVVEHFGWDRIPREHVARHGFALDLIQLRFAEWWRSMLGSLAP